MNEFISVPLSPEKEGKVHRKELVRLLADGLRDLGYVSSALALETESKTSASSTLANQFLTYLSHHEYESALKLLDQLPFKEGSLGRRRAKNFIVQERYLDSLLNERVDEAILRLHEEVYFLQHEDETDLDELAAFIACPTFDDLITCSGKLRAKQAKRFCRSSSTTETTKTVLDCIHDLLDSEAVVPSHRLFELLGQALNRQLGELGSFSNQHRQFDVEPIPLLKQIKEVEEERNSSFSPCEDVKQIIQIPTSPEIWSISFYSGDGKRVAVGTHNGMVLTYSVQENGMLTIMEQFNNVCGLQQPIVSLDWGLNGLICVSRSSYANLPSSPSLDSQHSNNNNNSNNHNEDNHPMEEEEEDNEEEENSKLISILFTPRRFQREQNIHQGRPLAKWKNPNSIVSTGPDGWLKVWNHPTPQGTVATENTSHFVCTDVIKVERAIDLTVCRNRVILACADMKVYGYGEEDESGSLSCIFSISQPDSIVGINAGFNSLVVSVKNQSLIVWNLSDLFSPKSSSSHHHSLTFRGLARKRFVLKPSAGMGDFIASGSEDGSVHIWSCSGNQSREVRVLKGHTAAVNEVAWNPVIPGHLITVGDDGSVRSWSRKEGMD